MCKIVFDNLRGWLGQILSLSSQSQPQTKIHRNLNKILSFRRRKVSNSNFWDDDNCDWLSWNSILFHFLCARDRCYRNIFCQILLKKWANPGLFLYIFVLLVRLGFTFQFKWQIYNLNNINWKKRRWCAWDSNLGRQDGRRRRIHWAIAAPLLPNIINARFWIPHLKVLKTFIRLIGSAY